MTHFQLLTQLLFGWALIGGIVCLVGLYAQPREFYRGFWFMNGLWCMIDGLVAWVSLWQELPTDAELANLLLLNSGLDVLYLIVGGILLTRPKPVLKGFGVAILFQGLCLLIFDLVMYFRVVQTLS